MAGGCTTATRCRAFPNHPHRGFETVTFVRQGLIDHSDSLGAAARYGQGDVQWLTAGSGIVHAETFPLLDTDRPNPAELFQIWVNLPRADKMAPPHFSMLWADDIPHIVHTDAQGRTVEITVVAGELQGQAPPAPPPALVGQPSRQRRRHLARPPAAGHVVDDARRDRATTPSAASTCSTVKERRSPQNRSPSAMVR